MSFSTPKTQNEVGSAYLTGVDIKDRVASIVKEIAGTTDFIPTRLLGENSWWGSPQIRAFSYLGTFKNQSAVLIVEGPKPSTSEVDMIQSFAKANRSKIIRPPKIFYHLPWNPKKAYEAIIIEDLGQNRLINTLVPTPEDIIIFFTAYKEYRANCISSPWIAKPKADIGSQITDRFTKWQEISLKIYPNHPFRKPGDQALVSQVKKVLAHKYAGVETEFMHGHFSIIDLYKAGNQLVLLSNLYWSWRVPMFDLVFAHNWAIYDLGQIPSATPDLVDSQKKLWLNAIGAFATTPTKKKLLNLALLERATAGLNLDVFNVKTTSPIAKYLVDQSREDVLYYLSLVTD